MSRHWVQSIRGMEFGGSKHPVTTNLLDGKYITMSATTKGQWLYITEYVTLHSLVLWSLLVVVRFMCFGVSKMITFWIQNMESTISNLMIFRSDDPKSMISWCRGSRNHQIPWILMISGHRFMGFPYLRIGICNRMTFKPWSSTYGL